MTLSGHYTLFHYASLLGARNYTNLNEDRFMRTFARVPWKGATKQQWDGRKRRFSVLSVAISSEPLEIRPKLFCGNMYSPSLTIH